MASVLEGGDDLLVFGVWGRGDFELGESGDGEALGLERPRGEEELALHGRADGLVLVCEDGRDEVRVVVEADLRSLVWKMGVPRRLPRSRRPPRLESPRAVRSVSEGTERRLKGRGWRATSDLRTPSHICQGEGVDWTTRGARPTAASASSMFSTK